MTNVKRNGLVDALRGWSLFGILLANLLIFQYGIFGKEEISFFNLSSVDYGGYVALKVLVENSFMPIFTFLFGYSLILMRDRLRERERRVKWHLFRRFLVLIGLGVLHSTFLWEGDILFLYGMMGMLLLFFVNRKRKTILVWCVILFSIVTFVSYLGGGEEVPLMSEAKMTAYMNDMVNIYSSGNYQEIKNHRLNVDPMELSVGEEIAMVFFVPFLLLPMMLLGMYAGHVRWLDSSKMKRFWYVSVLFIPLGLLLKVSFYLSKEISGVPDMSLIGGSVLAVGYIGLFGYIYSRVQGSRWMRGFESLGKLSLSNYILQTIICTTIFYGYGIGLFGKRGVVFSILFGIILFIFQVIGSTFYLKRFKQGPLEKVMRLIVYLENPFRRNQKRPINDEIKVS